MTGGPSEAKEDAIQEAEYGFPYHYIPSKNGSEVSFIRSWPWGIKYLAGMDLIMDLIAEQSFESLIEVGCGDGRLLAEAASRFENKELIGVDYSPRAISFAHAFNPKLDFRTLDVTKESLNKKFDVVLLSEVLEHIEPTDIPAFLGSLANLMHPESRLVITVPHENLPVIPKHFQHFSVESLQSQVESQFKVSKSVFFDRDTASFRFLKRLFVNRLYIVNHPRLQNWLLNKYKQRNLNANQTNCLRLAAVCQLNSN